MKNLAERTKEERDAAAAAQTAADFEARLEANRKPKLYQAYDRNGKRVLVTVPPSACRSCGGDGCALCLGTGDDLSHVEV